MDIGALDIRLLDIIDVLVVAYLMYVVYKLVRGTIAFNIFTGVFLLYILYLVVETLDMKLLSLLLGSVAAFGVIILIIIFQPEVREFLLVLGKNTLKGRMRFFDSLFGNHEEVTTKQMGSILEIEKAVKHLSNTKTGALIVFAKEELKDLRSSGKNVDAAISAELIENIFFKNAPLHDGAMITDGTRILAASCILPVSNTKTLASDLGLRHRAGIGITEKYNVFVLIISEETGGVSIAQMGNFERDIDISTIQDKLTNFLFDKT